MTAATSAFQTTDLNVAAFLLSRGHSLLGTEGTARRTFHFAASVAEDAKGYFQGATVPARAFANALRDLKAMVREGY
jgi:hypothetical protein